MLRAYVKAIELFAQRDKGAVIETPEIVDPHVSAMYRKRFSSICQLRGLASYAGDPPVQFGGRGASKPIDANRCFLPL
jgi:hypothetical protein